MNGIAWWRAATDRQWKVLPGCPMLMYLLHETRGWELQ